MSKKISFVSVLLISTFSFILSSCNGSDARYKEILDSFNLITEKVNKVEQIITISKGDLVIATKNVTYDYNTLDKITTVKVPNDLITSDKPWSVTTETTKFELNSMQYNLDVSMFKSLKLNNLTLSGVIDNKKVEDIFNLSDNNAYGDVTINFNVDSLETKNITNVTIDYVSSKGNFVNIVNNYTLK